MNKIMYKGQIIVDFDELADKYTKAEIDAKMKNLFVYKGTVANLDSLNAIQEKNTGDCYNVASNGNNYAWNGTEWDSLSGIVDLSNYYDRSQVDALIAGIPAPDLSNYYNKTEADAKIDEKIAAIPVNDLLHYKGHVSDVSLLPSLGQTTGTMKSKNFNLSRWLYNSNKNYYIGNNDVLNFKKYFLMYGASNSANSHFGFLTDYPEQIEMSIGIIDGTHPHAIFKVTYNPNKPVYFWCGGTTSSIVSELYVDTDGSLKQATSVTSGSTKNFTQYANNTHVQITRTAYFLPGMPYNGDHFVTDLESSPNMNIKSNIPAIKMFDFVDSFTALSWTWKGTTEANHTYSMFESLKHPTKEYYYNAGMTLFKFTATPDSNNTNMISSIEFISDEPGDTELNDTYTVGDNYDIYRRNEILKWEHWSQNNSYSKEEIDRMFGEAETALDAIIEGV